jgi:hypothetical protein
VPNKYQRAERSIKNGKDYVFLDQYKRDLISKILDIYSIRKPDLVINDMFYFLEGAGPFVYSDSNLTSIGFGIIGRDAVAVDIVTSKLVGIDISESEILKEARNRKLGITDISNIKIKGKIIENTNLDVKFPVKKLEDIKLNNTSIKTGRTCSGCFREAYNLLNFMKTHMTKDLKYIINQNFLAGLNPPEPESLDNVIVFGDCAIDSTKDREFRKIQKKSIIDYVNIVRGKLIKDFKSKNPPKTKEKTNKRILELPGCPPDLYETLNSLQKYYKKPQIPNLTFMNNLIKTYYGLEQKKK